MQFWKAFFAGVVGAAVMSLIMWMARAVGMPVMLELTLGSLVTGTLTGGAWVLGFLFHLFIGGLFALLYALIFEFATHRAGWGFGLFIGAIHSIFSGILLGFIGLVHPLIPEVVVPPGPFMAYMGFVGVVAFVVLHLIFGLLVGEMYKPIKAEHRQPAHAEES